jgi:hypothetical protein
MPTKRTVTIQFRVTEEESRLIRALASKQDSSSGENETVSRFLRGLVWERAKLGVKVNS